MVRPADLFAAIHANDLDAARALIQANPKALHTHVATSRDWGDELCLPLHAGVEHSSPEMVTLLLELGAVPDSRTRYQTPLHARRTAVHLAARRGDPAILERLLNNAGDPEVRDADSRAPLTEAAAHDHPETLNLLLQHKINPDPVDLTGRTPLHHAIRAGSIACTDLLLAAGVKVDHPCPKEPEAFTPLHRAVTLWSDDPETCVTITQALLRATANPKLADPRDDLTPLDRAKQKQADALVDLLESSG
ncbi:MAG: ankyrin repeat domain-containing protein [Phycisphaeraceae bacterium]